MIIATIIIVFIIIITEQILSSFLIPGHLSSVKDLPPQHCAGERHQVCVFLIIITLVLRPRVSA